MAKLFPFRALRPAPEAAAHVASVPYDVVNTEEARALATNEPLSFLHVTRSEIDVPPETSPYDNLVYEQAVRNFEALKRSAPLILEDEPALYLYRLRMGRHEQTGVAATLALRGHPECGASVLYGHAAPPSDSVSAPTARTCAAIHSKNSRAFG